MNNKILSEILDVLINQVPANYTGNLGAPIFNAKIYDVTKLIEIKKHFKRKAKIEKILSISNTELYIKIDNLEKELSELKKLYLNNGK